MNEESGFDSGQEQETFLYTIYTSYGPPTQQERVAAANGVKRYEREANYPLPYCTEG
jgi:hypothetical protein